MEMEPDFLDRYQRQLSLREVGLDGQRALRAARVMGVGLGGLGCPVVQGWEISSWWMRIGFR